jgi:hypothetical protein
MPDMPQAPGGAPASAPPAGGAPAPGGDSPGGGITDAIAQCDALVNKIASAVAQSQMPDEIKSAWSDALGALRKAEQALVQAAGGGEPEPDADDEGGATTMEQGGAKGAVPMTHQSMRG